MRVLLMTAFWAGLAAGVTADARDSGAADCFERVEREVRVRDTITVFINDSAVIRGVHPISIISSSILYMRPVLDSGVANSLSIPFEQISRITYSKPGPARWILALAGLGIGAAGGAMVGVAIAPEPQHWLEFTDVAYGVWGGVIGGLVGGICGGSIGKHFKTTVTLKCG